MKMTSQRDDEMCP